MAVGDSSMTCRREPTATAPCPHVNAPTRRRPALHTATAAALCAGLATLTGCAPTPLSVGGDRFDTAQQQQAETQAQRYAQRLVDTAAENDIPLTGLAPADLADAESDGVYADGRAGDNLQVLVNTDGTWTPVCIALTAPPTSSAGVCPGADETAIEDANQAGVDNTALFYASEMDFAAAEGDSETRNQQTAETRIRVLADLIETLDGDPYTITIDGTKAQVAKIWFAPDGTEHTQYACILAGNPGYDSTTVSGTC